MTMKIFVIAEREQPIRELCGGARRFADEVSLIALPESHVVEGVADTIYRPVIPGGRMSEDAASTIAELIEAEAPKAVFAEPSRRIQLLLGRVAARLQTSVMANVMDMPAIDESTTMYFGGLANRKLKTEAETGMFFIRPATFPDAEPTGANREVELAFKEPSYKATRTEIRKRVKGDVDLPSAKRIVSVGRGLKKEEDLAMIRELCSLIDAEMGCSRSLYEAEEWLPKEALVGISGNTVTPDLYLAVGISGQAQHTVACDGSSTIMCINTDPYALIFEHSDYGSKGDLYTVVPKMIEYFKEHPLK